MVLNKVRGTVGLGLGGSEENFSVLARDCSCGILVNNVAAFHPCPKSLPAAKLKNFGLIPLAEEISKQPSIDSVVWLLVLALMKIYNEKEQVQKVKIQNVQSEEKNSIKK